MKIGKVIIIGDWQFIEFCVIIFVLVCVVKASIKTPNDQNDVIVPKKGKTLQDMMCIYDPNHNWSLIGKSFVHGDITRKNDETYWYKEREIPITGPIEQLGTDFIGGTSWEAMRYVGLFVNYGGRDNIKNMQNAMCKQLGFEDFDVHESSYPGRLTDVSMHGVSKYGNSIDDVYYKFMNDIKTGKKVVYVAPKVSEVLDWYAKTYSYWKEIVKIDYKDLWFCSDWEEELLD